MGSNPIGPIYIIPNKIIPTILNSLIKSPCSGSVVRPIMSAFRADDSGSNPGRSILNFTIQLPLNRSRFKINIFAGVPERPKGTGLGPVGVGLRGFESLPLHSRSPNFIGRGGVGGYPTGLWIPRLGFESRPRPHIHLLFLNKLLSQ